ALMKWIWIGSRRAEEPHLAWLKDLVEQADPSGLATQLRRLEDAPPEQRRAALEKLADEADGTALPAAALSFLARRLELVEAEASAVRLLRRARRQYPGDFWLNQNLGMALRKERHEEKASWKERNEEAVRCLAAAVALRPGSAGAHLNLGGALL